MLLGSAAHRLARCSSRGEHMIVRAQPDRGKIDIEDAEAVRCWCRHFGVTSAELERAIGKVGNRARAVGKELGGGRRVSISRDT
ncbi:MAG: DUF3606 domain-containing protein [Alphaproteobacteria bacterium]|nr:DUF3606 domain-containing protein [Alphaproteobacteria bacterium]